MPKWNLLFLKHMEISFKNNIYNPIIVDGWELLQQHYNLPQYVEVCLGYLGGNNFKFIGYIPLDSVFYLRYFHSRNLIIDATKYFDIQIMSEDLEKSTLVCSYLTFILSLCFTFYKIWYFIFVSCIVGFTNSFWKLSQQQCLRQFTFMWRLWT